MAVIKFHKTTALPATLEPNSVYMVAPTSGNPNYVEVYVTDSSGTNTRRVLNENDVNNLINAALAGAASMQIVDTIADRDALTPIAGQMVLVRDASADPTVTSGAATYVWDAAANAGAGDWVKIAEYESLDIVLDWNNIQNGPNSTPAQIDTAVANSHTHANKTQLDKIGEDSDGNLTYGGTPPNANLATVGW